MAKLQAYELQDAGLDTVEANYAPGFECDCRDFRLPAAILRDLGVKRVRLLSNNLRKVSALAENSRWWLNSPAKLRRPLIRLPTCVPRRRK
jgi:GTP cyclohydrolase II